MREMIESGNLLQDLFEDSGTIVLITDAHYCIRYLSSSVQTLLGIEPISVIGKDVFEFVPLEKRQPWKDCIEQAGQARKAEILLRSVWGDDLYFKISASNRIANHEICGLVIMLHDITAQKQKAIDLQKEKEHLDQFIYKTTHDLRTPIHSALGLLTLMKTATAREREQYERIMGEMLNKLESLIEEVNHLYRVGKMAVTTERIDLRQLLESEINVLKNHPKGSTIFFELNCLFNAELFSDLLRIRSIVSNLLSNAVKYSDLRKEKSSVSIKAQVEEEQLIFTVTDNGIGIAQENLDKIFDIFFRATTEIPGTGLGLHIVKDTVNRLNGKIEVRSQLGQGTQFKILLPNRLPSVKTEVHSLDAAKAVL
ncbi:MAG: PAS domain-containing sensor histidine kinase [Bacteroidetes bacterium]|nr:PAS domain-containing sensor histidine kinase [Bacteroidota bacterium]